ncbi:MAG: phosphoribosylanthranilate isomerase [Gammaproteobacteria bacterium]|uniref:phosphoribosylanthranilate isomerase n=1 Tax=Limnobacter sp. TaxID=2003368 RepID=UPI001D43ED3B|nr:phosphoribosylanthranilate isomerase [Limnobacter sp.]MBU0783090.1 phosphoribosylanthranilate isomerase [Gammaproteobacteria bacterium]MBU0849677.1 phosphoribosylanthranilate isomerase [Gammaproteobacteria bacterium]MBU1266128.1 phosphoribosylanthranilate isomerase [Gammaproteobacteria bacterium]MBU1529319.1 phosphoribosylanthranilate isomerase [Gammaproteobacteria bacterium]MBU1779302.1 phosphoribosylanthranilate isomerase [Gammaproteobacteria bacterium]
MRTRIKLCGFQTEDTVRAAAQAGADAVGFVFYPPSPRNIAPAEAGRLARCLGAWQTPVALFVNPQPELVQSVIAEIPHVLLQFHGDESAEFCESFGRPFIKAIRMKAGVDLLAESARFHAAQALLVDSWSEAYGGTGHTFDWSLLPKPGELKQALVLSGGLDESNVAQAVLGLKPYGVDVSSGIESARGIKSIEKIEKFCTAVQKADAGLL